MKRFCRDYEVTLHFEASRENKQLFVICTMFEQSTLKQIDNTLIELISELEAGGHVVTMAEIRTVDIDGSKVLPNTMFTALMNIPHGITKGGHYDGT